MKNVRAAAALALAAVVRDGKAFSGALDDPVLESLTQPVNSKTDKADNIDTRDRALYRELCYGTLRHYFLLDALLAALLRKPLANKDSDIKMLLLLGLYQLLFMRVPDHAVLSATVNACKDLRKHWATGLVNAVLRNSLRRIDRKESGPALLAALCDALQVGSEAARASHPDWLLAQMQRDWPQHWPQLVAYNNAPPPMCLRINTAQCSREHYQQLLADFDIDGRPSALAPAGLLLARAVDVAVLPGFAEGWASVQDSGAQLAAQLLAPVAGERVLDACAAPGGKTAHLLQLCPQLRLTALDSNATRLQRVHSNLERCAAGQPQAGQAQPGSSLQLHCADAGDLQAWWDGNAFDKILLDAPCSGTGVISHHPDIKLLRRASDGAAFATQQLRLLRALWTSLARGGSLLYCTCSILPAENAELVKKFLATTPDAELQPLAVGWGIDTGAGHQLLPNTGENGGFFYAKLSKRGATESEAPSAD
ncbi:MAG: 16S rRNA (cytosine(967)-C(5))-methyltransferase RsmB [Gammaproteobacteria bacterium]|nr:16S rRNA (cytosine(967)-C(5))-methyltransferase RsmB [Gammaproteobacteria bacterium]